ncbi:hypothetical protein FB566_1339 [Stackebrandtia endophytica]|uniref:Uncharacterized protein n=1 Tax=Stackebrandtia endophytica TaxID=1496996 RepID=A0A543ATA6_9ACTN|nr:hypothetical protein FB566_1339 [Stackebrandtia endophytica]
MWKTHSEPPNATGTLSQCVPPQKTTALSPPTSPAGRVWTTDDHASAHGNTRTSRDRCPQYICPPVGTPPTEPRITPTAADFDPSATPRGARPSDAQPPVQALASQDTGFRRPRAPHHTPNQERARSDTCSARRRRAPPTGLVGKPGCDAAMCASERCATPVQALASQDTGFRRPRFRQTTPQTKNAPGQTRAAQDADGRRLRAW